MAQQGYKMVVYRQHVEQLASCAAEEPLRDRLQVGARTAVRIAFASTPWAARWNAGPNLPFRSRSGTAGASGSTEALRGCCASMPASGAGRGDVEVADALGDEGVDAQAASPRPARC